MASMVRWTLDPPLCARDDSTCLSTSRHPWSGGPLTHRCVPEMTALASQLHAHPGTAVNDKASSGDSMTLPCTYTVHKDPHPTCWGRGTCPNYGCSNDIIKTDGHKVTWRKSDRYGLQGDIPRGDVSLTIAHVTAEDGGTYCCRMRISGLFNDLKEEINVRINPEFKKLGSPEDVTTESTAGNTALHTETEKYGASEDATTQINAMNTALHTSGDMSHDTTPTEVASTETAVSQYSGIFLFFRVSALILFILTSVILSSLFRQTPARNVDATAHARSQPMSDVCTGFPCKPLAWRKETERI
ncbi:hepatitis A virus cellular receptor 1 homolog [Hyperolius riggenbachi]|uniref:hepatitis A virus cellular receptor 1 homolog n=1 Tax=Hyperolius riggenbachi TaxID=752182 RepID=UPI0035A2FB4C